MFLTVLLLLACSACSLVEPKTTSPKMASPTKDPVDNTSTIFQGLPQTVEAARYHSLAADKNSLPDSLKVTAEDEQGVIMAVQHKTEKLYGLQFHPESILTPRGKEMLQNFLAV